jgi:hypothetical protein
MCRAVVKDYFYRLLNRYFAVFIRPGDRALYVDPRPGLLSQASPQDVWVLATRPGSLQDGMKLLTFEEAKRCPWDYIVLNGNLHYEQDILVFLRQILSVCDTHTRVLLTHYSAVWKPAFRLADLLGLREVGGPFNWITREDIDNFARLSGFDIISRSLRILMPLPLPFAGDWINRWLAHCPGLRMLDLVNLVVLRPIIGMKPVTTAKPSVSVVIPARNEAGNIEAAFQRLPMMGPHDEIIFVEGN